MLHGKVLRESMPSIDLSSKQNWEGANRSLYRLLKKEIEMMRELLANLHAEELSLLEQNANSWHQVMEARSDLVMQVMGHRVKRIEATSLLEAMGAKLSKKLLDEASCELLSQVDQMIALIDRTNLQNCRNDTLFREAKAKKELPLHCAYPHPLHQPKPKRKTSTTTYPQP